MINGGFTGGSTNGGSGSFKVDSAYLVNLIASSVDMAESLGMAKLVLAGLELGGVIGSLLGAAVLLLCVTLFVLAVEEYKANVDNMFAYMSGDESAGDATVINAGINIAVTAAFSGASYLAKKQLAKYAAKQVTEKLGEELAERLLKEGADSTVIAKAVRSLEKSGMDNALIRKAAANLTAAEFDRIGALAKRGLAGDLLERVADNRAVLAKVSDGTLLLLKNSKSSADDIITVLLKHGDEAGKLYGQYGDDVIRVALRYGDEGLNGIRRHGTDFLIEYSAFGDEFVQNYLKYGDEAVEAYVRYGDDAAKLLAFSQINSFEELSKTIADIGKRVDSTNSQKINELQRLFKYSGYKTDVNIPSDVQYIRGFDVDGNVIYDWPEKLGFDKVESITRNNTLPQIWDRYGYIGGSNFSDVPTTGKYTYSERAIPYIENEAAYHTGTFNIETYFDKIDAIKNQDIDIFNELLQNEGIPKWGKDDFEQLCDSYNIFILEINKEIGDGVDATYGLKGTAAKWGDMTGGAVQVVTPLGGDILEKIGIIKEN